MAAEERRLASPSRWGRLAEGAGLTLFYACGAILLLHPLFADPFARVFSSEAIGVHADRNLVLWILAWDWHALTSDPLGLFDANILHPARASLVGNEHMLGVIPLSGPAQALTGNPLFAYSTALLLSISLSGTAMYALLRHWGVTRAGALFGGFVYALIPARSEAGNTLQLVCAPYLPLAIVFLDRTLARARLRPALAFGALLLAQMLCSVYWAFMSVVALLAYGLAKLATSWRTLSARGVALALGAAALAGVIVRLIHSPHAALRQAGVIPDQAPSWIVAVSVSDWWRSYLLPPIALREWGFALESGGSYYLGLVPLLAAASILFLRRAESEVRDSRAAVAIASTLTLAAYLLALGPEREILGYEVTLPYAYLAQLLPGFSSMRVPSRFGFLLIVGFAALAGIGMGRICERLAALRPSTPRVGPLLASAVVGLAILCAAGEWGLLSSRPTVERLPVRADLPEVYVELGSLPAGPVVELPFGGVGPAFLALKASGYMYLSTFHWKPLLNGYTGHAPLGFPLVSTLADALPDAKALKLLVRSTGLRYVIVHLADLPPSVRARWDGETPGLRPLLRSGEDLLLEIEEPAAIDLVGRLQDVSPDDETTLLGTPQRSLEPADRRGRLEWRMGTPERVPAREFLTIEVEATNPTERTWPAMGLDPDSIVVVDHRWERAGLKKFPRPSRATVPPGRLPFDLAPNESARFHFFVRTPRRPGRYDLVLGLRQGNAWFEGSTLRRVLVIEPSTREAANPTRAY